MKTDERLDKLIHVEAFMDFLHEVYAIRESLIQQLHDVSTDRIQQISGRILQCDDILSLAGYDKAVSRKG